jgi:hypothetical protein
MIKAKNLVPSVYNDKSRDFQLLEHIYEIVFNYLKTNIDTIHNNPLSINSDKQLIDLLTYTLGFKPKHKYNVAQLTTVCSSLMTILKNKGNMQSILYTIDALLRTDGIASSSGIEINPTTKVLTIYCTNGLTDTILFNDLLDYILPAGMSVNVFKQNLIENTINDYVNTKDDASSVTVQINSDVSTVPNHDNTSGIKPSDIGAGRIDNISVVPKN